MQWRGIRIGALALLMLAAAASPQVANGLDEFRQGRFAEAFSDWEEAAHAGDARGALYIGVLYDTGLGVVQNASVALDWYKRAADGGSAVGAFNAGILYDAGLGVRKNPREAARWYGMAAASGFGRAEYNLALLYEAGIGVSRNRQKAAALFRRALAHGVTAARAHLAALGDRTAVPAGPSQVTAMADFQQAQQMIAGRSPNDLVKAATVFRRLANLHDALAEYDLGYCYDLGLGMAVDKQRAVLWYRRAVADTKDPEIRAAAQASIDTIERVSARQTQP